MNPEIAAWAACGVMCLAWAGCFVKSGPLAVKMWIAAAVIGVVDIVAVVWL